MGHYVHYLTLFITIPILIYHYSLSLRHTVATFRAKSHHRAQSSKLPETRHTARGISSNLLAARVVQRAKNRMCIYRECIRTRFVTT